MGTGQSADSYEDDSKNGFHVLSVKEGSPAAVAGIEPFFDYIVAVNGVRLDVQDAVFFKTIKANIGKPLTLALFNSKWKQFREVDLIPSNNWGGDGLVGCSIRFCNFEHGGECVWHVMDVYPNSPASDAALRPHTDYIIGTRDTVIRDKNDLFLLIDEHGGRTLRLYVYNWQSDMVREVAIIPDPSWGGEGSLGCDIGFGYLHRIPQTKYQPVKPSPVIETTTSQEQSQSDSNT